MSALAARADDDIATEPAERLDAAGARIAARAAADRAAFRSALATLADPRHPFSTCSTPLFQVCDAVGRASGIALERPPLSAGGQLSVEVIARASGVRVRRISLNGAWWERDAGPLVAWRGDRPIALLPLAQGGYRIHDPAASSSQLVDCDVAADIERHAYIFYGALPASALGIAGLVRYAVRGSGRDLVRALAYSGAAGLLGLAAPLLTAGIIGGALVAGDRAQVLVFAGGLVISAICSALFNLSAALAVQRATVRSGGRALSGMWNRVLALPVWFFRQCNPAELAVRVFSLDRAREALAHGLLTSGAGYLFSLCHVFVLAHFAPSLTLPALALVAVVAVVSGVCGWLMLRVQHDLAESGARTAGRTLEFVHGVAKLRVAGAERRAFASWARLFARTRREALTARRISIAVTALQSMAPLAGWIVIATIAASDASLRLRPAHLLAFSVSFQQLIGAALELSGFLLRWSEISALAGCARPLLAEPVEAIPAGIDPGRLRGALELRNLSFRYERAGAEVLHDISFRVEPGEFVAFVGSSGSGKSTVLRLMLGFERPGQGTISYDGNDLSALDQETLRRQLGVVLQNGHLLAGTIASNILGASGLDEDAAWRAADLAAIADDIRAMPMGMQTPVPESGIGLSGGQRQRILLARALVSAPRMLLLDEATSALDNETQARVVAALGRLGITRIVIAHRLSTVRHADRIVVLESGRIVETGTYEELCARGGRFTALARLGTL
jgi:ATP-binding cassette subfamily C protein